MKVQEAPNPLAEGLHDYRVADPAVMVIFGATGDLTHRSERADSRRRNVHVDEGVE